MTGCIITSVFVFLTHLAFAKEHFSLISSPKIQWQFKRTGHSIWYPATIPGTVHTDLLANNLIPDPFFRDNEKKVQWIENEDWEYQTFFNCENALLQMKHIELQFGGLDTYADVYLNDSLILHANNMFRSWVVEVKRLLKADSNHLFIQFNSAVKKGKELVEELPYELPGDVGGRALQRKAQYQFGWDWGPRLVTCGVWKEVKLNAWNDYNIHGITILADSIARDTVYLALNLGIKGSIRDFDVTLSSLGTWSQRFHFDEKYRGEIVKMKFKVATPKLWWTNGLGDPQINHVKVSVSFNQNEMNGNVTAKDDSFEIPFGIRSLKVVQQPDSVGSSFYFELNGQPVFIKGANIIPPDNFLPRVSWDNYKQLVDAAVDCHMNMLRVWGGGAYLPDEFYDYCDEKGILIWQDFMFAGAMVPGDSAFIENVRQEAIDQVMRLRDHPCIALWCGNNEVNEAWHNWGFQDLNKSKSGINDKIWNDYLRIFDTILPQVVRQYDPGRFYWQSSPSIGWGHNEAFQQGDAHYWGVWWGKLPFNEYEKHVGRFMSEYGFQSMPSMTTIQKFTAKEDLTLDKKGKSKLSEVLNVHQKHPTGFQTIDEYLERDFHKPKDFESYVYVSQLLQRDGMAVAIEAHRRAKPYCMGTLYWQLNDCWPVVSWSSSDYYGNPKAFYYLLKDLYASYLISIHEQSNDSYDIYIVSDSTADVNAQLRLRLIDFTHGEIWSQSKNVVAAANSSDVAFSFTKNDLPHDFNPHRSVLVTELINNSTTLASKNYYFSKPKDLTLPSVNVSSDIKYISDHSAVPGHPFQYQVTCTTDKFAKDVSIEIENDNFRLSDNFFDLLPEEVKIVSLFSEKQLTLENLSLNVRSLRNSY